jgi:hypothetical protein
MPPVHRAEAVKRRAGGETLAAIAKRYAVDISRYRTSDRLPAAKQGGAGPARTNKPGPALDGAKAWREITDTSALGTGT